MVHHTDLTKVGQVINRVHFQTDYEISFDIVYTNSKTTDSPPNAP